MFEYTSHHEAHLPRNLRLDDSPDGEVDELVAGLGAPLSCLAQAWQSPRVCPISARFWAVIVGPICAAPAAARGGQNNAIELAVLKSMEPGLLRITIQKVMLAATHEDVHFVDNESIALLPAELLELFGDRCFPFDSLKQVRQVQGPFPSLMLQQCGSSFNVLGIHGLVLGVKACISLPNTILVGCLGFFEEGLCLAVSALCGRFWLGRRVDFAGIIDVERVVSKSRQHIFWIGTVRSPMPKIARRQLHCR